MPDIEEHEQRIRAALDRIDARLAAIGQGGDTSALEEALEAEKMAVAQLEERLRAVKESHEAQMREIKAGSEDRVAALQAQLEQAADEARANAAAAAELAEAQAAAAKASEQAEAIATLEAALAQATLDAKEAQAQVNGLRQSNQRLQASLQTLREASADEIEPHLINHAMMSEIEALRASRAAEQAELDEILSALKPLVEGGAHA